MEIQDWASIISAAVAVGSAIGARNERIQAGKSAEKAANAQADLAQANKEIARLQTIAQARENNLLFVSVSKDWSNLSVFNPLPYKIRRVEVEGFEIANGKVVIEHLDSQREKEILLRPNKFAERDKKRHSFVHLNWETPEGKKCTQTWEFPKTGAQ